MKRDRIMNLRSKIASVLGAGMMVFGATAGVIAQGTDSPATLPVDVVVGAPTGATVTWSVSQTVDWPVVEGNFNDDQVVNGEINLVVTDNRFNFSGWSFSLRADDFVGQATDEVIPAGNFVATPGTVRTVFGQSLPSPEARQITMQNTSQVFLWANSGSGSGIYSVSVNGAITIPANTQADTYGSTIHIELGAAPN
jgi:hypothetical protein